MVIGCIKGRGNQRRSKTFTRMEEKITWKRVTVTMEEIVSTIERKTKGQGRQKKERKERKKGQR